MPNRLPRFAAIAIYEKYNLIMILLFMDSGTSAAGASDMLHALNIYAVLSLSHPSGNTSAVQYLLG